MLPRESVRSMLRNYAEQQELASLLMTPTEIVDRVYAIQKIELRKNPKLEAVPESQRNQMIEAFTRAHTELSLSYRSLSDCLKPISETDVKRSGACLSEFQKTVEREKFAKGQKPDGGTK